MRPESPSSNSTATNLSVCGSGEATATVPGYRQRYCCDQYAQTRVPDANSDTEDGDTSSI